MIHQGGKAIYGAPLGILMQAWFPRIRGDRGSAATWPFPVLHRGVPGAAADGSSR